MPAAWEPDFTAVPLWTGTPSWTGEAPEPTDGPDWGDSDGDGLPNWFEVWLGTSPGNPDSDYDGISDYDEIFLTGTNPKHWDSDGDGFSDHDASYGCWAVNHNDVGFGTAVYDWDGDGLYNHEDPFPFDPNNDEGSEWMDSDGDGVEDGSDSHPWDSSLWDDWDFNGVNGDEEMPESFDSDGDGVADDSDSHPWDSLLWNDWNFNGVNDDEEFPDPYTDDNDGDGYVDADDSHPWDSSLWNDFDYNNINDHEETDGEYDPTIEDGDGDGVVDASDSHSLDPDLWSDYDEDGLNAEEEIQLGTNPYDADTDGDGLTDLEEVNVYLTNPLNPDTDGDGLTDSEELRLQPTSDPLNAHSLSQAADFGDLYSDWQMNDTTDTDGDGIPDRIEELYGRWLDPNNPQDAGWDADGDGVTNLEAYQNGWVIRTAINPLDRDGDGITDVQEDHWNSIHPGIFSKFRFSDAVEDADQDGLMNYAEIMQGSDPGVADSLYPGASALYTGLTDLTVWAWTITRTQIQTNQPLTMITEAVSLGITHDWFAENDANENGIPDGLEAFALANGVVGRVNGGDFDGDGMSDVWEWRYREALDPMDHRDAGVPGQAIPSPPIPPNYEDFTDAGTGTVDHASFSTAESDYQTALEAYQALGYHRVDPDDDGLCNLHEFQLRTNPLLADSDGDGVPDGIEVLHGGDPADSQVIPPLVLAVVSGHGQTVEVGQVTAQPLKVRVTSAGIPQSGRTIAFTASDGSLLALGGGPAATAQTNAQGEAQINWQAPMQSGLATITAAGAGVASPVAFNLNSAFPVLEMHVVSGRGQSVEVGKVAGSAITAQLTRGMLSPAGLWVTFTPTPGTGKVGVTSSGPWVPSLTLETNEQGQASVFLQAPSFSGTFGLDITAKVALADTSPGPFEMVTYSSNPSSNPPGGLIGPPQINTGHRANGLILFTSERFIEGKFNGLAGTGTVVNDQTSTSVVQEWVKYEDPPQHDGWDGDLDAANDPDDPGDPRDENLQLSPRLRHLVNQGTPGAVEEFRDEESSIPGAETIASFNQGYYNATNKIDKMKDEPEGRWELQTQAATFEPNGLLAGLQSIKWGFEDGNGWWPGLHGWMGDGAYGIVTKTAATSHGVSTVFGTIPPTGGNATNQPWSLSARHIDHQRRQIRVQSNRVITQEEGDQSVSFIVLQTTKGKLPNGTDAAPVIEAKGSVTFTIPVGENVATEVETSGDATTMIRPIPYVDLNALGLGPPLHSDTISQAIELIPPLDVAPNESVELSLLAVEIVPDYNRDGKIHHADRGKVNANKPWRWWINDDDDEGELANNDTPLGHNHARADCRMIPANVGELVSQRVDGVSDLPDFFPVYLGIRTLLERFPPDQPNTSYRVVHPDAALNFLETDMTVDAVHEFLTDDQRVNELKDAHTRIMTSGSATALTTSFLTKVMQEPGKGILLVKGASPTTQPFRLEVWKDGGKLAEVPFYVNLSGIEDMYRWINLRGVMNNDGTPLGPVGRPTDDGDPPNRPDDETSEKHFVFAHGYNVNENDARGWGAEVFKRLYQLGMTAKFTMVTWCGDYSQADIPIVGLVTADYWTNASNAFLSAVHLKNEINALPGTKVIAAHSLGNMVVSSAIVDYQMNVEQYFMLDAAVPLEAYDETHATNDSRNAMRNPDWQEYNEAQYWPYWASDWHKQFLGSSDARQHLTWKGRFGNIPHAINYYSSGEEVLRNGDGTWPGPGAMRAWVYGEMGKGRDDTPMSFVAQLQGGWGYNPNQLILVHNGDDVSHRKRTPAELLQIPLAETQLQPYFRRFQIAALHDANQGSATAQQFWPRAQTLAGAIPALSFPAGSNPIASFELTARNQDLMGLKDGWPQVRLLSDHGDNWLHSDAKNLPLRYNHKLFTNWITRGGLKEP